ncbi:MAG: dTMP kinase [Clostridiales bacterium]|nr:dTMP kinase [Clostridiales bacterium]
MEQERRAPVISLEGGDGSGKTSVLEGIRRYLESIDVPFLITREPGGVLISERIRDIVLDTVHEEMDPRTEALLFAAARRQHLAEKVFPAVKEGKWVVFDRYVDSSLVYQGFVRGIGIDAVYALNVFATESFLPDLTLYLDVPPEEGLKRIERNQTREVNRLDLEALKFHEQVREGYWELVRRYPDRIKPVDASKDLESVIQSVIKEIELLR